MYATKDIVWKEDENGDLCAYHSSDLRNPVVWAPQEGSQIAFLTCPVFECCYVGSRGPGKTIALIMDYLKDVGQGYGSDWVGVIFRQTYPELRDVKKKADKWIPKIFPTAKYNKTESCWTFKDGEKLFFAPVQRVEDYQRYHGHEYTWQGWEELTTWPTDAVFKKMQSLVRCANKNVPLRIRATSNPGDIGHTWVKKRYGLPVLPGRVTTDIVKTEGQPDRVAVHGMLHENKVLQHADPMYIQRIESSCENEAQRQAWIFGSWDITSGGMFDDLWEPEHHIIQGLNTEDIPKGWRIDRSYDHGQSRPFSVGFWAQSNGEPMTLPTGRQIGQVRGDLIRIDEWYGKDGEKVNIGKRLSAIEIAEGIISKIRSMGLMGRVYPGVADASIFDEWEPKKSVAGDMAKRHIKWLPADKSKGSRKQGWQQIRRLLKQAVPITHADGNKTRELPGLFVSSACVDFLRTVPVLPRMKKDLDDVDTDAEDHIADETRYRCRAKRAKKARVLQG